MAKMGRPPKSGSGGPLRGEQIHIRVTREERDVLYSLAARAGVSVTAFLLGCALGDRLGGVLLGEGFTSSEEARKREEEGR